MKIAFHKQEMLSYLPNYSIRASTDIGNNLWHTHYTCAVPHASKCMRNSSVVFDRNRCEELQLICGSLIDNDFGNVSFKMCLSSRTVIKAERVNHPNRLSFTL